MRSVSRWRWHLDEVFVKLNGKRHSLWRAVDHEGDVHESFVTKRRDKRAALKFHKKATRRHWVADDIVTDRPPAYRAAMRAPGCARKQRVGRWDNNQIEDSHLPFRRRERAMLRFRRMRSPHMFAAVHSSFQNDFNHGRRFSRRDHFKANRAAALAEWRGFLAA